MSYCGKVRYIRYPCRYCRGNKPTPELPGWYVCDVCFGTFHSLGSLRPSDEGVTE